MWRDQNAGGRGRRRRAWPNGNDFYWQPHHVAAAYSQEAVRSNQRWWSCVILHIHIRRILHPEKIPLSLCVWGDRRPASISTSSAWNRSRVNDLIKRSKKRRKFIPIAKVPPTRRHITEFGSYFTILLHAAFFFFLLVFRWRQFFFRKTRQAENKFRLIWLSNASSSSCWGRNAIALLLPQEQVLPGFRINFWHFRALSSTHASLRPDTHNTRLIFCYTSCSGKWSGFRHTHGRRKTGSFINYSKGNQFWHVFCVFFFSFAASQHKSKYFTRKVDLN